MFFSACITLGFPWVRRGKSQLQPSQCPLPFWSGTHCGSLPSERIFFLDLTSFLGYPWARKACLYLPSCMTMLAVLRNFCGTKRMEASGRLENPSKRRPHPYSASPGRFLRLTDHLCPFLLPPKRVRNREGILGKCSTSVASKLAKERDCWVKTVHSLRCRHSRGTCWQRLTQ